MVFVEVLFKLTLTNVISNSTLEFYSFPTANGCMMHCFSKQWCVGVFYSKYLQACRLDSGAGDKVYEEGWNFYQIQNAICPRQLNYTLVHLSAPLCYKINDDLRLGHAASQYYCEADGGSLIILDTQEKNDFIRHTLMNMIVSSLFRIGLSEVNGNWVWSSGSNLSNTYIGWADGEPNKLEDEFCGALLKNMGYYWIDYTCDNPKSFICEIDMSN